MVGDRVANFIVALKNAGAAKLPTVSFPYSKLVLCIAEILEKEGYIKSSGKKGKKRGKFVEVELLYKDGRPAIQDVKRVSHQSRRIYRSSKDIYPVRNGFGMAVISTTKGLLSDRDARAQHVGGEVLFEVM